MTKYLVAEEAAGDVDLLAPHHHDFLAGENLLGDDRGQSTKEVTLAINNDGCRGESGHHEIYTKRVSCRPCRARKVFGISRTYGREEAKTKS